MLKLFKKLQKHAEKHRENANTVEIAKNIIFVLNMIITLYLKLNNSTYQSLQTFHHEELSPVIRRVFNTFSSKYPSFGAMHTVLNCINPLREDEQVSDISLTLLLLFIS